MDVETENIENASKTNYEKSSGFFFVVKNSERPLYLGRVKRGGGILDIGNLISDPYLSDINQTIN